MIDSMVVLRSILETAFYFLVISSLKQLQKDQVFAGWIYMPRFDIYKWLRSLRKSHHDPVISYLEPLNGILARALPIGTYNGKAIHQAIALENGDCYRFDRIDRVPREQLSRTGAFTIRLAADEYVDGAGIIYRRM